MTHTERLRKALEELVEACKNIPGTDYWEKLRNAFTNAKSALSEGTTSEEQEEETNLKTNSMNNEPAFPCEVTANDDGTLRGIQTSNFSGIEMGLTKREWFAGMALQGLLSNSPDWDVVGKIGNIDQTQVADYLAIASFKAADAMIAQSKNQTPCREGGNNGGCA